MCQANCSEPVQPQGDRAHWARNDEARRDVISPAFAPRQTSLSHRNDSQLKKDRRAMRVSALRYAGVICLAMATLWPATASADGVSINSASKEQKDEAMERYSAGVSSLEREDFDAAVKSFRESFETVASPNSRLMLGQALIKAGRLSDAYRELEATLALAKDLARGNDKYDKTVGSAEDAMKELRQKLAFVTVEPSTKVTFDGDDIPVSAWSVAQPVKPGKLAVRVEHDDGRKYDKELDLSAGETASVSAEVPTTQSKSAVALVEKTEEAPPATASDSLDRSTVGWVSLGVGVAGFGTFGLFTALNEISIGNAKASCNRGTCPEEAVDDGKTKGTNMGLAVAGLVVGVAGAGVGTYLLLTGDSDKPAEPKTALVIGPASLSMRGSF